MSDFLSKPCTAFRGASRIASGPLAEVALAVKAAMEADPAASLLTFDDATGAVVDLDLRGGTADVVERLSAQARAAESPAPPRAGPIDGGAARGPGRPKLGVVAREVTLLPRHWDWLAAQAGGASPTLRRLVEEARRGDGGRSQARAAQAAAYKFLSAMAGDLAGFEEASRALFAGDQAGFATQTGAWPADIRAYALALMTTG